MFIQQNIVCSLLFLIFVFYSKGKFTVLRNQYLKILGLDSSASKEDIKKAFRSKAKTLHPDKNPSPKAQEEFIKLCEAYEALTNGGDSNQYQSTYTDNKATYYSKKYNRYISEEEYLMRAKKAKQYAEFKNVVEKNIHNISYQQLMKSTTYKVAIIMGSITILLAVILTLDYKLLPRKYEQYYITYVGNHGIDITLNLRNIDSKKKIQKLELNYNIFNLEHHITFKKNELVQVEFTPLFDQPVAFSREGIGYFSGKVYNESTFYIGYWPFVIIFTLPLLMFIFRGKNSFFIILTPLTIYLSSFALLIFIYYLFLFWR